MKYWKVYLPFLIGAFALMVNSILLTTNQKLSHSLGFYIFIISWIIGILNLILTLKKNYPNNNLP